MPSRLLCILLSVLVAIAPVQGFASQNNLFSPTTGTISGLNLTNNYNNALDSVNTANSGPSAPTNQLSGVPSLGNWWLNTTSSPYPIQVYDGANWLTPFWIDASNHYTDVKIGGGTTTIASAATVDLCNGVPQAYIKISGTTTITSFGSTCNAGHAKFITFTGILTLTYNATNLIIPGGANITTAAGDQAVVISNGSGNWQVISYTPASGQALINPAIDVGAIELTFSPNIPSSKYLWAYGQTVLRTTYSVLQTALTVTQSVTRTNGSPTLTGFSDTTQIASGTAAIEGSGIPPSTTIISCGPTSCTMSANATSSGTSNVTVFPYGDGDGSTTFNLPNCQGVAIAGRDNMSGTPRALLTSTYFGPNPDALGAIGGAQSYTFLQANLPNISFPNSGITLSDPGHHHTPSGGGSFTTNAAGSALNSGGFGNASATTSTNTTGITISSQGSAASGGSGTPLPTITPSITANCMIRVLARLETAPGELPALLAANDDFPVALIRRRQA
jgi:microcystin-dependent protein